jgi:transposase-like protein
MARNRVQFQKGLSEAEFERLYGTEVQCREAVARWRWPDGFACPACGGGRHSVIQTRALYQCSGCRKQTSLIAGTIFASTKVPLRTWFRAMYHLTQSKGGMSSIELGRRLGVTQTTAWKIKHKLMQVMLEREMGKPLTGRVEMDDAYLGGARSGGKRGRGAAGKTAFLAAVETTPEGKPVRLKLRRVKGFRKKEVETAAKVILAPGANVVTDGLACFSGVTAAGCTHHPAVTGSGRKAAQWIAFKWVNTTLGNIKSAITGTYRAIRPKHVPRYLASFAYRFNRRYDLTTILTRLGYVAVRTPPMPYRLLKLAEDYA